MRHPVSRAILFDLDDTLYLRRRFVSSGFRAVAAHLEQREGHDSSQVFEMLVRFSRGVDAGRELQACLARLGMPESRVPNLVEVIRAHRPTLRLPGRSRHALESAVCAGWRVGIVTNGLPSVQASKIAALGLDSLVDTVVYAAQWGTGCGKPEPAPFLEALRCLDVTADRAVFVGDDDRCDIAGAAGVGMRTIWFDGYRPAAAERPRHADAILSNLRWAPRVAAGLLTERADRHAA
jgi:FMN phosphatase YigB (HAD superfamily)